MGRFAVILGINLKLHGVRNHECEAPPNSPFRRDNLIYFIQTSWLVEFEYYTLSKGQEEQKCKSQLNLVES